jgi:hypothetical protein
MKDNFETEVLTRLAVIESKLDDYKEIKDTALEAHNLSKDNEKEIEEIKDKMKWLSRTLIGAIITAGIAILFAYIKIGLNLT